MPIDSEALCVVFSLASTLFQGEVLLEVQNKWGTLNKMAWVKLMYHITKVGCVIFQVKEEE